MPATETYVSDKTIIDSSHAILFADRGSVMTKQLIFSVRVLFVPLVVVMMACGGAGEGQDETDSGHAESMTEESVVDSAPSGEMEMIVGGHATLVHEGAGGSPHVNVHWDVNDANITVNYGRPLLKGRVVGESVEPMADRVWRLGADEATVFTTDSDVMLGDTHIPAGEYTLWTAQMDDEFHLIVNSETGQWGTNYDPEQDFAHIPMMTDELDSDVEQLEISIGDGGFGFSWGRLTASVPLMVD